MQFVLYGVLFVYSLPLLGIVIVTLWSRFFSLEIPAIYVAAAISGTYLSLLRDLFASIVVPLVTAFSIQIRSPGQPVPRETKVLFAVLLVLFVFSITLFGIVIAYQQNLERFNEAVFTSFRDATMAFWRESLTYVALAIGISVKQSSGRGQ